MATPPFPAGLVTDLQGPTAWRFRGLTSFGKAFYPRFFCCTDPNALGLSDGKEPVALIELDPPDFAYVGDVVNFAGTLSYDPDGSIVSYAWTFESHTPATGTASSGTLTWGTAGLYTVGLTVTDGTGNKSTPAKVDIFIAPKAVDDTYLALSGGVSDVTGVVYTDGVSPVEWVAKNTGVDATDNLLTYDVVIDPATQNLPLASRVVWRAGGSGGLYASADGGDNWTLKAPGSVSNSWADSPAPVVGSLSFRDLHFANDRLYAIGTWQNGSAEWRSWLFYSDNASLMRSGTAGTVTWSEA